MPAERIHTNLGAFSGPEFPRLHAGASLYIYILHTCMYLRAHACVSVHLSVSLHTPAHMWCQRTLRPCMHACVCGGPPSRHMHRCNVELLSRLTLISRPAAAVTHVAQWPTPHRLQGLQGVQSVQSVQRHAIADGETAKRRRSCRIDLRLERSARSASRALRAFRGRRNNIGARRCGRFCARGTVGTDGVFFSHGRNRSFVPPR